MNTTLELPELKFDKVGRIANKSSQILREQGLKWCGGCKTVKSVNEFHKVNGHSKSTCKQCTSILTSANNVINGLTFKSNGCLSKASAKVLLANGQKWCYRCKTVLNVSDFYNKHWSCKKCDAANSIGYRKQITTRFNRSATSANRLGHMWSISISEYEFLVLLPCIYCGFKITSCGSGLDRLNNNQGYELGNVVSCCKECNVARNNNFSPQEMLEFVGPAIRAAKLARLSK